MRVFFLAHFARSRVLSLRNRTLHSRHHHQFKAGHTCHLALIYYSSCRFSLLLRARADLTSAASSIFPSLVILALGKPVDGVVFFCFNVFQFEITASMSMHEGMTKPLIIAQSGPKVQL